MKLQTLDIAQFLVNEYDGLVLHDTIVYETLLHIKYKSKDICTFLFGLLNKKAVVSLNDLVTLFKLASNIIFSYEALEPILVIIQVIVERYDILPLLKAASLIELQKFLDIINYTLQKLNYRRINVPLLTPELMKALHDELKNKENLPISAQEVNKAQSGFDFSRYHENGFFSYKPCSPRTLRLPYAPLDINMPISKFTTLLYRLNDKERYEMLERYISITEQISSHELSHLLAPFSKTPELLLNAYDLLKEKWGLSCELSEREIEDILQLIENYKNDGDFTSLILGKIKDAKITPSVAMLTKGLSNRFSDEARRIAFLTLIDCSIITDSEIEGISNCFTERPNKEFVMAYYEENKNEQANSFSQRF